MILLPNQNPPRNIESDNYHRYADKFHVYHSPVAWSDTGSTPPAEGYSLDELKSGVYNEWCVWDSGDIHIKGSFGAVTKIDTIIFGKPSFNYIKGFLYKNGVPVLNFEHLKWITNEKLKVQTDNNFIIVFDVGPLAITRDLAPQQERLQTADQGIVIVNITPTECDSFDINMLGDAPVSLNKIYFGVDTPFSLASTLAYPLRGNGKGGMTDIGVAYGTKYPSSRAFTATWDLIDDRDRRVIEDYISTVQNVEAHYIFPVTEDYYIPPMFVQLQKQNLDNKRQHAEWYWQGIALEWMEAR